MVKLSKIMTYEDFADEIDFSGLLSTVKAMDYLELEAKQQNIRLTKIKDFDTINYFKSMYGITE